jgi:hypothetical protein
MQPSREALQLAANPKLEFLEGGEKLKGIFLLLCEALHLFVTLHL